MTTERENELIACAIVEHCLPKATVKHVGDEPGDGMIDGLITYLDGRTAALEVVGDHDPNYRRLDARIRDGGSRIDAPTTLRNTWILNLKDHPDVPDVRAIRGTIVTLLATIEASGLPDDLKWPDPEGRLWMTAPNVAEQFTRLGVQRAISLPGTKGRVYLERRLRGGVAADPNQLVDWVEQLLNGTASDVPKKLATSGYEERHAFIWATETTDYAAMSVLEVDEQLPTVAPRLPGGITHLWISSDHAGRHRVVMWEAGNGWRDVYQIPDDGVIPSRRPC
jgi:hypothetical protein